MTKDDIKKHSSESGCLTFFLPFIGVITLFLGPLLIFAPVLFLGSVAGFLMFIIFKIKEKSTHWILYECPYCYLEFEAEPKDTLVRHIKCKSQVVLQNGQAYKLGELKKDGSNVTT
ncbi:MAG: hypothetical protein ACYCX4_02715 [Bacillota bacterium]